MTYFIVLWTLRNLLQSLPKKAKENGEVLLTSTCYVISATPVTNEHRVSSSCAYTYLSQYVQPFWFASQNSLRANRWRQLYPWWVSKRLGQGSRNFLLLVYPFKQTCPFRCYSFYHPSKIIFFLKIFQQRYFHCSDWKCICLTYFFFLQHRLWFTLFTLTPYLRLHLLASKHLYQIRKVYYYLDKALGTLMCFSWFSLVCLWSMNSPR